MVKEIWQYDPCFGDFTGCDPDELVKVLFYGIDNGRCKPDIILWETHRFLPAECPSNTMAVYRSFEERGINIMKLIIDETHKRGIKSYMHYRICEVDEAGGNTVKNDVKAAHPDWITVTWCSSGMWNLAAKGLREYKLDYLRRMLTGWEFDGVCVDFLRHLPCLPVGEQWEHRGCVTEFMEGVRAIADTLGREFKTGAKLPENLRSCKVDGFDAEKWIKDGTVDFVVAGSRSLSSDVAAYKALARGTDCEIYPCWDTWHSSDATHWREDAFYRGIFAKWLCEGADGVVGFNYVNAPAEVMQTVISEEAKARGGMWWASSDFTTRSFSEFHGQLEGAKDVRLSRIFALERRGGYPYGTGAGGTNHFAPLPLTLGAGIPEEIVPRFVGDSGFTLRLLISGLDKNAKLTVKLDGKRLDLIREDSEHIDALIHYPNPQRNSGARYCYTNSPTPLYEAFYAVPDGALCEGSVFTVCSTHGANLERFEIFFDGAK